MASYKGRVKRGAEVGGSAAFVWFVFLSAWGLLGGWQQMAQAVDDWPGFVRWLGQPQTPAILVAVAALVYLAALLWPEPNVDPLTGKFFHTYHDDGELQYQGHVIREQGGRYFIQLYSAVDGAPTDQRFMTERELETAKFYGTEEAWHDAFHAWSRRHQPRVRRFD